jgi:hypothetical protein
MSRSSFEGMLAGTGRHSAYPIAARIFPRVLNRVLTQSPLIGQNRKDVVP